MSVFLTNDHFISAQAPLIKAFGRTAATFLQQLHYWYQKQQPNNGWIYNTAQDWAKQLCVSNRTVQRVCKKLHNLGVLEIKRCKAKTWNQTNHFRIDYTMLDQLITDSKKQEPRENSIATLCRTETRHNDGLLLQKIQHRSNIFSKKEILQEEKGQGAQGTMDDSTQALSLPLEQRQDKITSIQPEKTTMKSPNVPQQMLNIWQQHLGHKAPATMNAVLAKHLQAALKHRFNGELEQWQTFVKSISQNAYLMGESFSLSIFWAVSFTTIDRLKAGDFVCTKSSQGQNYGPQAQLSLPQEAEVLATIEASTDNTAVKELRKKLLQACGVGEYISYFAKATISGKVAAELKLVASNAFVEKVWFEKYVHLFDGLRVG